MRTAKNHGPERVWQFFADAPLTWLVCLISTVIASFPAAQQLLEFDATAIAAGDYWRFFTGHVVHWNFDHCVWDLSVFVALGLLCERRQGNAFRACVLSSAAVISIYMLWMQQDVLTYRGLSGIDTGLFTLLAVGMLRDARANGDRFLRSIILMAVVGLAAKTCWEFCFGSTLFVDHTAAAFIPIPMAHVLGAGAGLAVGMIVRLRDVVGQCDASGIDDGMIDPVSRS